VHEVDRDAGLREIAGAGVVAFTVRLTGIVCELAPDAEIVIVALYVPAESPEVL
jgi:hypothetical protein